VPWQISASCGATQYAKYWRIGAITAIVALALALSADSIDLYLMASSRRQILKLGVVDFGVEHTILPNGAEVDLAIIRHPGASAIVALDNSGNVALLSQYRHAIGGYVWEIPAGVRHADETTIQCAQRELAEEAGLSGRRWDSLGTIVTVPSFCDERIELFLARELDLAVGTRDFDEVIRVEKLPFAEALRMIRRGEIVDAKTIAALYLAHEFLVETGGGVGAIKN
jgi:ADP-ribose pyrophosphatase